MSYSAVVPLLANNITYTGQWQALDSLTMDDQPNENVLVVQNGDLAWEGTNGPSQLVRLNTSGMIAETQLPSYVAELRSYANLAAFPNPGDSSYIYIANDTAFSYRWNASGSAYVAISSDYSYSKAVSDGKYLFKAGDTMTGNLQMGNNNITGITSFSAGAGSVYNLSVTNVAASSLNPGSLSGAMNANSQDITGVNHFTSSYGNISSLTFGSGQVTTLGATNATINNLTATLAADLNANSHNITNGGTFTSTNSTITNLTATNSNLGTLSADVNANNHNVTSGGTFTMAVGNVTNLNCANSNLGTLSGDFNCNNHSMTGASNISSVNASISGTLNVGTLTPTSISTSSLTVSGNSALGTASFTGNVAMGNNSITNCSSIAATTVNSTTHANTGTITTVNETVSGTLTATVANLQQCAVSATFSIYGKSFFPTTLSGTMNAFGQATLTGSLNGSKYPASIVAYQYSGTGPITNVTATYSIVQSTAAITVTISGGTSSYSVQCVIWS